MTLRRRDLLAGCGLALVAGAAAAQRRAPGSAWDDARALFALDDGLVHLSSFLLASHPKPVREAIEWHRAMLDREPVEYVNENHDRLDRRTRRAAARYLEVEPDELILTDSTTMGLGLVYAGLALAPGDDVLMTEHAHFSTRESLRLATERSGASLRKVALYEEGARASSDEMVDVVARALRDETRVVALTWVHSSSGVKVPVAEIASAVARANAGRPAHRRALVCVDGVHGLGVEDAAPRDLGCDVFVAGTHKSLYGPRGTGVVWVKSTARDALAPLFASFTREQGWGGRMTPGGFHSFEHRWALAEAFDLHRDLGRAQIAARVHALATRLKDGLASDRRVVVRTPRAEELSASIVSFDVRGLGPRRVVERLRAASIVATVSPYDDATARLAPAFFNTEDEIDRAVAAVHRIASRS